MSWNHTYNLYKYRHIVDDHNTRRRLSISLDESWTTQRWPNSVLAFILDVSKDYVMLPEAYFTNISQHSLLDFMKQLTEELIKIIFCNFLWWTLFFLYRAYFFKLTRISLAVSQIGFKFLSNLWSKKKTRHFNENRISRRSKGIIKEWSMTLYCDKFLDSKNILFLLFASFFVYNFVLLTLLPLLVLVRHKWIYYQQKINSISSFYRDNHWHIKCPWWSRCKKLYS